MGVVRKDWASQNSIALSWQEPELPALPVLDYEIKYYEKVQRLPGCAPYCVLSALCSLLRDVPCVLSLRNMSS